jgi:hypothetical protein
VIPAIAGDPRAVGIFGGIFGQPNLRFGQRARAGQVQGQRVETQPHQMYMRIHHARNHGTPAPVHPVIDFFGRFVAAFQQLDDLAIIADHHAGELRNLAVAGEGQAVDVHDQRVRRRRRRDQRG